MKITSDSFQFHQIQISNKTLKFLLSFASLQKHERVFDTQLTLTEQLSNVLKYAHHLFDIKYSIYFEGSCFSGAAFLLLQSPAVSMNVLIDKKKKKRLIASEVNFLHQKLNSATNNFETGIVSFFL